VRVLHVIPTMSLRYGGPTKACREMAEAVAARGHEVEIFTTDYDGFGGYEIDLAPRQAKHGVLIRTFPVDLPPRYLRLSRPFAQAVRQRLTAFDLVHIHSLYFFTTLAAGFYANRHGVPYVLEPHGSLDPYLYWRHRKRKRVIEALYQDRLFKRAAAVHYTSAEERALAAPYSFARPSFTVPLGLDVGAYRPLPPPGTFRARYPQLQDKRLLLFFGRLNFKKGLDILAQAFGRVARRRTDVHLVITGPDNDAYRPQIEAWLREAGVLGRTTFTGMLTGPAKLAVLNDADLFLLPSYTENFGIAVVEAMACRLPVLISDKVNIWRDVKAEGAGEVEPCDPERVAARILAMLADPGRLAAYGQRGEAAVRRLFDWSVIGARMEAAYEAIIAGRSPEAA
jgi:glycosyltransferase involved in cell wall biosynthesis